MTSPFTKATRLAAHRGSLGAGNRSKATVFGTGLRSLVKSRFCLRFFPFLQKATTVRWVFRMVFLICCVFGAVMAFGVTPKAQHIGNSRNSQTGSSVWISNEATGSPAASRGVVRFPYRVSKSTGSWGCWFLLWDLLQFSILRYFTSTILLGFVRKGAK